MRAAYTLRRVIVTLLFFLSDPLSAAAAASLDAHDLQMQLKLQAAVVGIVQSQNLPGASVAVVLANGRFLRAAAGFADCEKRQAMTPDSLSLGASTGKTFVAALTMALAQEGRLQLTDPISKWLSSRRWFPRLTNASSMTVASLLNHTSGLEDHVFSKEFRMSLLNRMRLEPNRAFTPDELVEFVLDQPALSPVGRRFHYSDTNYILLGLIIERAGGAPYYAQIRRRFLVPLKLRHTVASDRRRIPGLVCGFMTKDNAYGLPDRSLRAGQLIFNPASEWTGGGFATTASDLAQWSKDLFEGRALPQSVIVEMVRGGLADPDNPARRYGLGIGSGTSATLGQAWGHSGGMPFYSSLMRYYPEHRISIAILVNTDDFDRDGAEAQILPQLISQ